ncbi:hypothetical protein BBK82_20245 [Lentzea guizhouensis]|uniref:Uncharacterized protein n=1 Tax=Lentzea guizhouensis TaxID=1586287 RepID=A0A1B2HK22_9PSEU|nr:hypothetical protein [Lentzea guizhouensis]ANZ38042.1 hypothetical protein BBK82_20245 [Lentzea guizhouensis]
MRRAFVIAATGMTRFSTWGARMIGWIGACFVFARRLGGWLAVVSALTGLLLMVPMAFLGNPSGTVLLCAVATTGWLWTSVVSLRVRVSST